MPSSIRLPVFLLLCYAFSSFIGLFTTTCVQAQRQWRERRDHLATLELPANLDQLSPEKQCIWVKKQHRKLARKWHPDKYRGNPERGSRKMREVSESKKVLSDRFKCK